MQHFNHIVWNVDPIAFSLGPLELRWYGILFASAFLVGYFLMRKMYRAANRTMEELDQLLTYVMLATVIGARLGHVLFYDPGFYFSHPFEIIAIWHGGLASHGAAIGILLAMYLYTRKVRDMSFLWLADRVGIVVASGGAFIRVGNFINSEILGKPSDLPWAVIFKNAPQLTAAQQMTPRHPAMLYEALRCVVIFGILWYVYKRYKMQPPEGGLFGIFLTLLFGGRFLLEYFKMDQAAFASGVFSMGQWLSIPLILYGLWLLFKKANWGSKAVAS